MTQPISSRKASASGIKLKVNSDFHSTLAYDVESTRNSVGLVHPFVLESFFQDTYMALELSRRKTAMTAPEKSSKTTDIRKNEERNHAASPSRVRHTKNVVFDVRENKLPDSIVGEKLSTSTKTSNKSKIVNNELNSRKDVESKNAVVKTISNAKNNEVLPTRVLRSAGKYTEFKRELKSVSDFSIENMEWYYEDENYYKKKLQVVLSDFTIPKENRREGNVKLSYTYLLLDSRKCINKTNISWLDFIEAIFYIGKGKNDRAFKHAEEAEKTLTSDNKNYLKIKEIWNSGNPIKVLIATENVVAVEALTREALMIDALGLRRLCNRIHGSYYGVAVTMKARERLELGAILLIEARDIFRWKKTFDIYPKKKTVIVSFVRPKGTTTFIDLKESPKNEEIKNRAVSNRTKDTKNVGPLVEEKKQSGILRVEEKPPASTKTFNNINSKTVDNNNNSTPRKIITTKTETDETKSQTILEYKANTAKAISNVKKNEVLPTRDFSIENIDWYYKNKNDYMKKMETVLSDFAIPKNNRREGNEKLYYNFLLLDSRKCKDKTNMNWLDFIEAIFYTGKGKNDRAVKLVEEAERVSNKTSSKELFLKVREIWNSGNSVKVFLVTESIAAEEAYTRSAAMIDAMSLNRLCNERRGSYYEKAKTMKVRECLELGATLLMEARDKFKWKKTIDVHSGAIYSVGTIRTEWQRRTKMRMRQKSKLFAMDSPSLDLCSL